MPRNAWTLLLVVPLVACSGRRGGGPEHGTSETTAAVPADAGAAAPVASEATMERPSSGSRWENGYLLAPDSPDPLACETEADCTCAMLVAEDGCCQPSIWPFPQTRAYAQWLGRHLASDECRERECPPGPLPAPPLPCQSKARCFEGRCSTACPHVPDSLSVLLDVSDVEIARDGDGVLVTCNALLRNMLSSPIVVRTNFHSVFDGVTVVVSTPDGVELRRQAYIYHQSPFSSDGTAVELPSGETTERLVFPLTRLSDDLSVVRVRLEGDLPRVPDSDGLRSEEVDVTIEEATEP